MVAKCCSNGGSLLGCSLLALRRDFATDLMPLIEFPAQRNGRNAEANERQLCQALTGVPRSEVLFPIDGPLHYFGASIQNYIAVSNDVGTGPQINRMAHGMRLRKLFAGRLHCLCGCQ